MLKQIRVATVCMLVVALTGAVSLAEGLESDWNDFLHYTAIGRFDLAKGFAQRIIDSNPDPIAVLRLSESNPNGYRLLLKMQADSDELQEVSGTILDIIERGRFELSTEPRIINQEIQRLSSTIRARLAAEERLKNAGEYAIPFMLDALADESRKVEFSNITAAIPKIGRDAIRPLVAALQTPNVAVRAEIIRSLGKIQYPQSLGYLKWIVEQDTSPQLQELARQAMEQIDAKAVQLPAAELFFVLAEKYYFHAESVAPNAEYSFANIWFWDEIAGRLRREEVEPAYFNELMAMRCCEWALKADPNTGKAIALWIASFFKAESYGIQMPAYFGSAHADAMTYATTAGPEYLHPALDRALKEKNGFVALGVVEALAANAGEKSLLYRVGTEQPLVQALDFENRAVRYSAAIAIGQALPGSEFIGSKRIIENLAEAITNAGMEELGDDLTNAYALRAINVLLHLVITRNPVVNVSESLDELIAATFDPREQMQVLAGQVLARLTSPDAQRAIADMALSQDNSMAVRISAFASLSISAKQNARLLTDQQIDAIYALVDLDQTDPALRKAAAGSYGALNLPSKRVKDLILGQSRS
ncbi:MAG: HEAT repeat domain-containing protein [Sedimentisphaerales bacterium]|nr:HEAT repeat domain-containing protein [Sedimentisphaerales bacterium]